MGTGPWKAAVEPAVAKASFAGNRISLTSVAESWQAVPAVLKLSLPGVEGQWTFQLSVCPATLVPPPEDAVVTDAVEASEEAVDPPDASDAVDAFEAGEDAAATDAPDVHEPGDVDGTVDAPAPADVPEATVDGQEV
jgi:hypothetical protein